MEKYIKINWKQLSKPAVTAENMNHREDGIKNAFAEYNSLTNKSGNVENLETIDKRNLVKAINEIYRMFILNEPILSNIEILIPPDKINFFVGDPLNLNGMVLKRTFHDGTIQIISANNFEENGIVTDPRIGSILKETDTSIKIIDDYLSVNQPINIAFSVLESISIEQLPTKMSYYVGDNLSLAGIRVGLRYSNGSLIPVPLSSFDEYNITSIPANGSPLNTVGQKVIISCENKKVILEPSIMDITVTGIVIKTQPTKVSYYVGDALNLSGLVVTLNYNNSTKKDVGLVDFGANGITTAPVNGTILIKTDNVITVKKDTFTATKAITISDVVFTGMAVKQPPTKVVYNVGDSLFLSGVVIKLSYNNGTTKDVPLSKFAEEGIATNPEDNTTIDNVISNIYFYKDGKTTSYPITVNNVILSSILIKTPPTKISYVVGNALNLSGLVVTLNYSNGIKKDVGFTDFGINNIITNPVNGTILNVNNTTVVISCSGKTINQALTISQIVQNGIDINPRPRTPYISGEKVNWSQYKAVLKYSNNTTKEIQYSDFYDNDIQETPVQGTILTKSRSFYLYSAISDRFSPSYGIDIKDVISPFIKKTCPQGTWSGIAGMSNMCLVVGNGKIMRSMNSGDTWDLMNVPSTNARYDNICYGNSMWVCTVDDPSNPDAYSMISTDYGDTWTIGYYSTSNFTSNNICYGNGIFIISGTNDIITSSNGINWTRRSMPSNTINLKQICYGKNIFVGVGGGTGQNTIITSSDGITWTARISNSDHRWKSVCYGNGLFVAVANDVAGTNVVLTSSNGINWEPQYTNIKGIWDSVCYGYFLGTPADGAYVATGNSTENRIMISQDGKNWAVRESPLLDTNLYDSSRVGFSTDSFIVIQKNENNQIAKSKFVY